MKTTLTSLGGRDLTRGGVPGLPRYRPLASERVDRGQHVGRGPRNYTRSDERIFEDVCERLADDPDLDASDIEVAVDDGVVTLGGWVDTRDDGDYAADLAAEVLGVADVVDWMHARRRSAARTRPIVR